MCEVYNATVTALEDWNDGKVSWICGDAIQICFHFHMKWKSRVMNKEGTKMVLKMYDSYIKGPHTAAKTNPEVWNEGKVVVIWRLSCLKKNSVYTVGKFIVMNQKVMKMC